MLKNYFLLPLAQHPPLVRLPPLSPSIFFISPPFLRGSSRQAALDLHCHGRTDRAGQILA